MGIQKKTVPYEVLFRLNEDGSIRGCHRRDLEVIYDDETDEVIASKDIPAQGVDDLPEIAALVEADLVEANDALKSEGDTLKAEIRAASDALEELDRQLKAREKQAEEALSQAEALAVAVQERDAQLAEREKEIAERDLAIADKNAELAQRQARIAELEQPEKEEKANDRRSD